jgi:hypothetical protein
MSKPAFGTTFRVTGGYLKARTSFLKMVTGKIVRTTVLPISDFIEANRDFILNFLHKKAAR